MLSASRIDKRMRGGSEPLLVTADDGSKWVVKFQNNPQGLRSLVNEWVCHSLAKELGLPIPGFSILSLPEELIIAEQVLASDSRPLGEGGELIQHGTCFGERYISNPSHPGPEQMNLLTNGQAIPGVVIFDTWVGNWDREDSNHNLLVAPSVVEPGKFDFKLIDYSVIISRLWRIGDLNSSATPVWFYGRNEYFAQYLKVKNDTIYHLNRLTELPLAKIESAVKTVPFEWGLKPDESDALVRFLDKRREDVVRKMYESLPCLKA